MHRKGYISHDDALDIISKKLNVPRKQVKFIVRRFFSVGLKQTIESSYKVTLYGFGSFKPNRRGVALMKRYENNQRIRLNRIEGRKMRRIRKGKQIIPEYDHL